MAAGPRREAETADMRDSIQDVILNWFDGNEWQDDLLAERIAEKIAEAPERFISPNPDSCGSYWEEASRIYKEIKDEYGLRTVSEGVKEADDYADQRKQFAAQKLREEAEAIRDGERADLVRGIEEDLGPEFVIEALSGTVADPEATFDDPVPEPVEAESVEAESEPEPIETETETEVVVEPVGFGPGTMDGGGEGDSPAQPWGLPATNGVQSQCSAATGADTAVADGGTDMDAGTGNLITNKPEPEPEPEQATIEGPPSPSIEETVGPHRDKDPEHWPDRDSEIDLREEYKELRLCVGMIAAGEANSMIIEAPPGIGKTYQIKKKLRETVGDDGFRRISGKATPATLFEELYEVSDGKVLFLDDIEGLVKQSDALGLIKAATEAVAEDDGDDVRTVSWRSKSSKIECPEEFEFKGQLIMCFNEFPSGNDDLAAVKDRGVKYDIDFTHSERLKIVREIAKKPYKDLTFAQRMEIVDWIEDHAGPGDQVTIRLFVNICNMRSHTEEEWETMAQTQVDFSPELARIRELCRLDEHETTKSVQEAWCGETGKGRRTFFRKWEKIKQGLEEDESLL